jgi:hypothetical protein
VPRYTYICRGDIHKKSAVVDLHIPIPINTISINSSALQVACPPPGIGAKKVQESSETRFGTAYILGVVTLESAGIDLDIGTGRSTNSSALQVACGPPGHRGKFSKFSKTNSLSGNLH